MKKLSEKIYIICLFALVLAVGGAGAFAVNETAARRVAQSYRAENTATTEGNENRAPTEMPAAAQISATAADAPAADDRGSLLDDVAVTDPEPTRPAGTGKTLQIGKYTVSDRAITPINVNRVVNGYLNILGDKRVYSFDLSARGYMQIGFNFGTSEVLGVPWVVTLYENYASDGGDEKDAFRLITSMNVYSTAADTVKTETTGLYPGSYVIVVSTGDVCSVADFAFMAAFKDDLPWEAEPNDTKTRYNALALNTKTGGSSANSLTGDTDWYMIELPARGIVNIEFSHKELEGASVGWFVTLRNDNDEIITRMRSYQRDGSITSGEIGLDAGIYYITVESNVVQTDDYFLTCSYQEIKTYETENNDTPATANYISTNGREGGVSGSLSDKDTVPDRDYYKFLLDSDGVISFLFVHPDFGRPRDGWNVKLLDANGAEIYKFVSRWNTMTVTTPQIGLNAGTYYILVDGENMLLNSGTYVIGATFAGGSNWESERNDTFATADPLALNTPRYGTLVNAGLEYDVDYYTFTLDEIRAVTVTFAHDALNGDSDGWHVSLLDQGGKEITGFRSLWNNRSVTSTLVNLSPGRYYIKVDTGTMFSSEKYSVTVNVK